MQLRPVSSRYLDLGGPLHVADYGGTGRPIVCVHGLGGAHVNWAPAARRLAEMGHVTAVDLPGSGLTPPAGRSAGLGPSRDVLDRYLESLGEPVTLIGNSMGGILALLQAALSPRTVDRLVLVSPAAPFSARHRPDPVVVGFFAIYLVPGMGRGLVRGRRTLIDPERVTRLILEICTSRPGRITADVLAAHVEIAVRRQHFPGIDRSFLEAARSLVSFVGNRTLYDRHVASVVAPTLVIHGDRDRLVPHHSSLRLQTLRPDWRVEVVPDAGHVAMLELPVTFGDLVAGWLGPTAAA